MAQAAAADLRAELLCALHAVVVAGGDHDAVHHVKLFYEVYDLLLNSLILEDFGLQLDNGLRAEGLSEFQIFAECGNALRRDLAREGSGDIRLLKLFQSVGPDIPGHVERRAVQSCVVDDDHLAVLGQLYINSDPVAARLPDGLLKRQHRVLGVLSRKASVCVIPDHNELPPYQSFFRPILVCHTNLFSLYTCFLS